MWPYFLTLFIVMVFTTGSYIGKNKIFRPISIGFAVIVMAALAGLRDTSVGTDTVSYIILFNNNYGIYDLAKLPYEYGFTIFVWLIRQLTSNDAIYLTAVGLAVAFCFAIAINVNVEKYHVAFFLLLTAGFYTGSFNTARQGLALAIFSMAMKSLIGRKFFRYVLIVSTASMFHISALIVIPVYFLLGIQRAWVRWVSLFGILFASLIMGRVIIRFAFSLSDKYDNYNDAGITGGFVNFTFSFFLLVLFIFFSQYIKKNRLEYLKLLDFYAFGIFITFALLMLSQHPSGALRVGSYFSLSQIFLWPIIFLNLRNNLFGYAVGISFFVIYLAYFHFSTSYFGNLAPYIFR